MESHIVNETPQVSNCTSQDANFQITCFTDSIGEDIRNAFLLHIGTNTNMSMYMMNIYKDENYMSQDGQIQRYGALDLQIPTELQKNAQEQNEKANIAQYLNIIPSKYNEWIMYKTAMSLINDYVMNTNIQSLIKT